MSNSIIKRTKQWWQPKASNLLSSVYLAFLLFDIDFLIALSLFLPAVITILGIGLFGYFCNDITDLSSDRKAGKSNMLSNLNSSKQKMLLFGALLMAVMPWFILPFNTITLLLLGIEFLLLLAYAFSPFRLKERGFIALITDALYAYAVPFLLAFYTFSLLAKQEFDSFLYLLIFCWQFFVGLVNILIHQIDDYENDLMTKTKTWVVAIGKKRAKNFLFFFVLPISVAFFISLLFLITSKTFYWYFSFPLLMLILKYGFVFYKKSFTSFAKSLLTSDIQKLNIHYHLFFPYWHLLLLIFADVKFVFLLLIHYFLFNTNTIIWWCREVFYALFLKYVFISIPSKILNFAIYYFRIWIKRETPEIARREHYAAYIANKNNLNRKNTLPNVAVVSSNLNKYTETFISQHEKFIIKANYYVHRFYGGYFPTMENKSGHLVSNNATFLRFFSFFNSFFDKELDSQNKRAFKDYLTNNNINLVIAEFGQPGAEISAICKDLGIPLLVVFYGYDAHHKKVLEDYKSKYTNLFLNASGIIGVSKDIVSKLEKLGASKEKLFYLPCAIDLNKFIYKDHSKNNPVFLTVGRFSETKSPHLTILAFNEVLKSIPKATLVMIGKDGGGELFEACHILVRALKIESQVVFKGICTSDEVLAEMNKARVFVQHSLTTPINNDKEGTPVAIMEAMANGLPVVATQHAGIEELIVSGENGFLVPEYDYLAMANAMILVCQSDSLVLNLGRNASESMFQNELIKENEKHFINYVNRFILKDD